MEAQLNARRQAEELHNYMAELLGWQKEMKDKERKTKEGRHASSSMPPAHCEAPLPAAAVKPQDAAPTTANLHAASSSTRHPAAHIYDNYRDRWERFDADAALAEAEDPSSKSISKLAGVPAAVRTTTVDSSTTGPSNRPSDMAVQAGSASAASTTAEGWRERGNMHFRRGEHQQAADCYTRAAELDPRCHLALANRAMACLRLGELADAEADCSAALALAPSFVKAWQRRATARRQLGNLLGAAEDYDMAARLEPASKAAAAERRECLEQLAAAEGLVLPQQQELGRLAERVQLQLCRPAGRPALVADGEVLIREVSTHKAQQTEQGPGSHEQQRALVQAEPPTTGTCHTAQLGVDEDDQALPPLPGPADAAVVNVVPPASANTQPAQVLQGTPAAVGTPARASPLRQPSAHDPQSAQRTSEIGVPRAHPAVAGQPCADSQPAPATATVATASAVAPGSGPSTLPAMTPALMPACTADAEAAPTGSHAPAGHTAAAAAAAAAAARARRQSASSTALKAPRTGVEFERAWRGLGGDPHRQAQYLLLLPVSQLPSVLRQALTPPLLAAMLAALLAHIAKPETPKQEAAAVLELLEGLPAVPRFEMNLLSLSAKDKARLGDAWNAASAPAVGIAHTRLATLRPRYRF